MSRTIAIGDIHGALKALKEILSDLKPLKDDHFVFLGDYVDGWPESAQVVEFLDNFSRKYPCSFIRGNHDVWCEQWLQGNKPDSTWLQHGGRATIESYKSVPEENRNLHLSFFSKLQNYIVDGSHRLFIHAGYATKYGPEDEFKDGKYNWDRSLWETALKLEMRSGPTRDRYPPKYLMYNQIFIGHTPTIFYEIDVPIQALNIWNLDTGAGFDGKLSAMDIDSGTVWQSSPLPDLYPGLTGRTR